MDGLAAQASKRKTILVKLQNLLPDISTGPLLSPTAAANGGRFRFQGKKSFHIT